MVVCFLKFCHSYGRTGDEFMHRHGIPSIGKTGTRLCLSTCIYNLGCKFCDLTLIWETRRFAFHNWKARLFDVPTWLWTSQTLTVCFQTLKLMYLKHKQGKKCMHEGSLSIVVDSSPPNLLDTFRQLVACKARPAHGEKHESIYIYNDDVQTGQTNSIRFQTSFSFSPSLFGRRSLGRIKCSTIFFRNKNKVCLNFI